MSTASPSSDSRRAALLAEYGEVCSNFRELTEIRFKLLAFLPFAAAASAVLAGTSAEDISAGQGFPLFLFGFAVTVGLVSYNKRNDQLYNALVGRAARIERELELADGAFANRQQAWLRIGGWQVAHGISIRWIYASTIALWLFGVFWSAAELIRRAFAEFGWEPLYRTIHTAAIIPVATGVLAVLVTLLATWLASHLAGSKETRLRELAALAGRRAARVARPAATDRLLVEVCAELLRGKGRKSGKMDKVDEKTLARARAYADFSDDEARLYGLVGTGSMVSAHLVAAITDLPAAWIDDMTTGRREYIKRDDPRWAHVDDAADPIPSKEPSPDDL
jgi:hypothetical protein